MKWVTKCPLNSLKVEMVLGANLLNHTLAGPLSMVGNALHIISSKTHCRCIRVFNDSRRSSGSLDLLYTFSCGIQNLIGRGKEVTCVVKGELVWWTSSSNLVDTHPFMVFIIIYIFSFIICMSCAMCIAPLSSLVGWSMSSYRSSNVTFFLMFSFLPISRLEVVVILFFIFLFVTLVVGKSYIPLVQLLLQLLIVLGEPLDCRGEGLHLHF